ncbi:MAG TPA: glycosyltransferase family 2 protein [bacterium]|nr:glycosyltransferase family 2 protein [bacterium]
MNFKYCSIILVHYALVDDHGGKYALKEKRTRSEMLREVMDSIEKNTDYPAELIVYDNGGEPDDSNYLLDLTRKGVINIYVRYKNNMHWAWAFNEGSKISTGDYLCFTCNDVVMKPKWLSICIAMLEKYPDRKFVASPFHISHKQSKYDRGTLDKNRLNSMAGSNCMIMSRETFKKLGNFGVFSVSGTYWFRKKAKMGYTTIMPPKDLADHIGFAGGLDWRSKTRIKKTLLNNQEIDFTERAPL